LKWLKNETEKETTKKRKKREKENQIIGERGQDNENLIVRYF